MGWGCSILLLYLKEVGENVVGKQCDYVTGKNENKAKLFPKDAKPWFSSCQLEVFFYFSSS